MVPKAECGSINRGVGTGIMKMTKISNLWDSEDCGAFIKKKNRKH